MYSLLCDFAGLYFCLLQLGFVVSGPEARVWRHLHPRREIGVSGAYAFSLKLLIHPNALRFCPHVWPEKQPQETTFLEDPTVHSEYRGAAIAGVPMDTEAL